MKELYKKYQAYLPALFFAVGFLLDLLTVGRIDQSFSLIQQLTYLVLIFILYFWEWQTPQAFKDETHFLGKAWKFHVEALHFLFGSLLSLYTLFYFKSASLISSFVFMLLLIGLLVVNELPQFQKQGTRVRSALLSLCLLSYLIYLVPVLTGEIGWLSFFIATNLSVALFLLFFRLVQKKESHKETLYKNLLIPGLLVPLVFFVLYLSKILPPVPISLQFIGIYHHVEKKEDSFQLFFERSWWRFWESGAQTFTKRPNDQIYCFVSIFSPTQFSDELKMLWFKKDSSGWTLRDSIPFLISGGRDDGFRGYTAKSNFEEGDWKIRIETSDQREVGRIYFRVSSSQDPRPPQTLQYDLY